MSKQPYIGLRPFERHETDIFFGREQHTYDLINCLSANQFLAVIGLSGCGKSSLVKTGLIAGLELGYLAKAGTHWRIVEIRPGKDKQPFKTLADSLFLELNDVLSPHYTAETLQHALRQGSLSLHELLARHPLPKNAQVLIFCDQFEEIFRYFKAGADAEIRNFVSLLLDSSKPYPLSTLQLSNSLYVVITMRSDYLGDCAQFAGLAEAINQGLYLTPRLDTQQLREAIEEPALAFDGVVDPALISQLLDDAQNSQDQLPLLQHVLMRLWDLAADHSKALNLEDYKNSGGLVNALSIHADEAYNALTDEQKNIAQAMFCLLTGHDLGKRDTRRPIELSKIMALTDKSFDEVVAVIDVFRQPGRCFLMPPIDIGLTPGSMIDISHESLIRQWQRLKDWVKNEAEAAAVYKRLADGATRWQQGKAALLQSPDLEIALAWQEEFKPSAEWAERYDLVAAASPSQTVIQNPAQNQAETATDPFPPFEKAGLGGISSNTSIPQIPPAPPFSKGGVDSFDLCVTKRATTTPPTFDLVTDYIKQSQAAKQQQIEQEQQEQQRKLKQARVITTVSVVGLLIVSALAFWVWRERNHATLIEKQRTTELFQAHLTHASLLAKGEDYAGTKKILEQTYPLDKDIAASSQHARNLLAGFAEIKGGQAEQVYKSAGYPLFTVTVSPDGQLLAAAGEHGTLVIFDVQTGELLQRLEGHSTENIYSIVFAPTGEQLISAGEDKKIIVWQRNENSFSLKKTWLAPDKVNAVALSPDGNTLASGGDDNNITLWELASGKAKITLKKHTQTIAERGLSFSANGDTLASASYDGTVIIWQASTGKALQVLTGHTDKVLNVAFSADGKMLATASKDKTLRLWDVATGQSVRVLTGHQNKVFASRFLANGAYILSGGGDRTIRLWDSQSGVTLRLWQGHEAGIQSLATYANQLFSAGNDGTVRRWSLAMPYQQAMALPGEPISNAIAPDLDNVAVGFADGALRYYDLTTEHAIGQQQSAHNNWIMRLAFNTQGDLLASGSFDNSAKVWRVVSSQQSADLDKGISLEQQQTLTGHTGIVHAVAFSPNSQTLATASYDGTIGLFHLGTEEKQFIQAHNQCQSTGCVEAVNFNKEGTQLLSNGNADRTTKLWNLQSTPPSLFKEFPKANDEQLWSCFSPDNQLISTVGREFAVNIYNTQNNQLKYHLLGHENTIYKSIFAPDSLLLATVSGDTTVKLWNLNQGDELFTLHLPANPYPPVPMWDFDFRCRKTCRLAVPLTAGKLLLYQFAYEGRQEFANDKAEQKRTSLTLWQDYLAMGDSLYQQNALQPALQAHREADIIGNPLMLAYLDDTAIQETAIHSFHQYAQLQKSLNQIPEALAAYQKVIEMSEKLLKQTPNNQQLQAGSILIFIEYAEFLSANKLPEKVSGIYQRVLTLPLEDVNLLVARAGFANRLGNKAALEKDLLQAFEKVDKQNADQLNSVGFSLATLTNRYPEAYQLLTQALALKPEDANILDSLGWILYKMGKNQEALDYLQKSYSKKNELPLENIAEVSAHLGEVLWVMGKQNQATELFKKTLHDYPDSEIVIKTVKQFAPGLLEK